MTNTPPVSGLESHLGYWLRYVSNHVSHSFSLKLAARNVTVAEWFVLRDLFEHEQTSPNELASRLGMTRGAISKLIDRLEAKSLVTKETLNGDRRYRKLVMTAVGRGMVPVLTCIADENEGSFFGHLTPDEREQLTNTLRNVVKRQGLEMYMKPFPTVTEKQSN